MFKQGSFVVFRGGGGSPFKVELATHFSAFGAAMPLAQQCEEYNVYGFRGIHEHMLYAMESELEQWIPSNEVEAWICQDITRLWPRYLHWQHVAEMLGVPVEALIGSAMVAK